MGIPGVIAYYSAAFEKSILPHFLVVAHASLILFFEYGMAVWLFSGFKLSLAWKAAALLLVSLAIGMIFAGKYDVAGQNYIYVFISVIGLLLGPFDRWVVGSSGIEQDRKIGIADILGFLASPEASHKRHRLLRFALADPGVPARSR
jgi:hypothetical protein